MTSSDFLATYNNTHGWLALLMFCIAIAAVVYYFTIRLRPGFSSWPLIPSALLLGVAIWLTASVSKPTSSQPSSVHKPPANIEPISNAEMMILIERRCVVCHAPSPEFPGYATAPLGIELESEAKVLKHAERVYQTTARIRSMPVGNMTRITEQERKQITAWYEKLEENLGQ